MTDAGLIDPDFMQPSAGMDEELDPHFGRIEPPEALTAFIEVPAAAKCAHLAELLEQFPYSISEAVRCACAAADALEAASRVERPAAPALYDSAIASLSHAMMWTEVAIDEYDPVTAPYEYRYGDPAGTLKRCAVNALMTDKGRRNWLVKLAARKAYYERYAAVQFICSPDNWMDSTTLDGLKRLQEWLHCQLLQASESKELLLQDLNDETVRSCPEHA